MAMSKEKTKPTNEEDTKLTEQTPSENQTQDIEEEVFQMPKVSKKAFLLALLLILLGVSAFYFKSVFVAATVNGKPISRYELVKRLEQQSGKQMLEGLVTESLLMQEAKKQNIKVTKEDVAKEIKNIEETLSKQGVKLETALTTQNLTRESLEKNVTLQLTAKKLVEKDVKITDKDIADYIAKNKDSLPKNLKPAELNTQVKDFLTEQKIGELIQTKLEMLKKDAKIINFVKY